MITSDTLGPWGIPIALLAWTALVLMKIHDWRKARVEAPQEHEAHERDVPPAPGDPSTTAPALHRMREASAPRPALARRAPDTGISRWAHDAGERRRSARDVQPARRREARRTADEPATPLVGIDA